MKVITPERHLEVSDDMDVKTFGIQSSPKFFRILSDGLYRYKIRACIRELSTNAYDSHVANGNPEAPFKVHLPIWTDKVFWIRDYGTGMSPETIDKLYTWYGASNRDQSNEFTGCQGLGSKTPFCYHSRAFNVESWWNGKRYLYSCFFNKEGIPSYSKVYEEDSDEPTGIKISFGTDDYDRWTFEQEAQKVYQYFDVLPEIEIEIKRPDYILEGNGWKLKSDGETNAIMGQVAYPVTMTESDLPQSALRALLNGNFDIFCETGELDIESSREGLSYDNRTINKIKQKLRQIQTELSNLVSDKIKNASSLWEARCLFNELYHKLPDLVFKSIDFDTVKWNGKSIFEGVTNSVKLDKLFKDHEDFELYVFKPKLSHYDRKPRAEHIRRVKPTRDLEFYEVDTKTGFKSRGKERCETCNKPVYMAKFPDSVCRIDFCDTLGLNGEAKKLIKKVSSLPKPTRTYSGGVSRDKTAKVMLFKPNGGSPTRFWENEEKKLSDGGLYVEWKRYRALFTDWIDGHYLGRFVWNLENAGISVPNIYGIKAKHVDSFKSAPTWINFFTWAKEEVKKKEGDCNRAQILYDKNRYDDLNKYRYNKTYIDLLVLEELAKKLDDTDINEFIDDVKSFDHSSKTIRKAQSYVLIRKMLKMAPLDEKVIEFNCMEQLKTLSTKYKLLKYLDSNSIKNVVDHVCSYIYSVGEE